MGRTPWAPGASALAAAARAVDAVVSRGHTIDAALAAVEESQERSAVHAIALGTVRWYLRLEPAIEALLERPRRVEASVRSLLVCAAHQVEYSRNVPQATVHAAVDAVRLLGKAQACGFANAVLRRFVAGRAALLAKLDADPAVRTAHPAWLVTRLEQAWPGRAGALLDADNAHPPMTLRVNLWRTSVAAYRQRLLQAGIESQPIEWLDSGLNLDHPRSVSDLPGFADGDVSVQDAGAQIAAALVGPAPGQRVLDACAAPGGKTGHLIEAARGAIDLTALDVTPERVALIGQNLARLKGAARLVTGDLRRPDSFWDGRPYERILVDAPCSSTGVIRRHPDIKLLRRTSDVPALAAGQLEMLRSAVELLAPGGRLVYCTCSVLPEENEQVVARLLEEVPGVTVAVMPRGEALAPGAVDRRVGVQLLPGAEAGTDGFYYACLEKTTTGT